MNISRWQQSPALEKTTNRLQCSICRERQASAKNLRQKEKKLKDLTAQMEDERKQAQDYKDQVTLDGADAPLDDAAQIPSHIFLADGEEQRPHEAAETSAGGGRGGGAASGGCTQETAEGAGRGAGGQRRSQQGGVLTQEQTEVIWSPNLNCGVCRGRTVKHGGGGMMVRMTDGF